MVDTLDLGSSEVTLVKVRLLSSALGLLFNYSYTKGLIMATLITQEQVDTAFRIAEDAAVYADRLGETAVTVEEQGQYHDAVEHSCTMFGTFRHLQTQYNQQQGN